MTHTTYTIHTDRSHQATTATRAEAHELAGQLAQTCQRTTITNLEGYRFSYINHNGSIIPVAA